MEEVLLAVSCPQWPISCILLEHFVSFIVNHLRENDKTAKKDSSHSVYLLDLLGTVTTGVKRYSKQATNEKKQAIDAKIPVALLDVLDKKIFLRKLDWINWLQSGVLGLSQSVMANSPKVSKAEDKMNYTFSVLAEIKNYMFGALLELPPDSLYPEFPIDILQSLITPMEILRRLAPNHDDLIR